jgi:hypothetical protein
MAFDKTEPKSTPFPSKPVPGIDMSNPAFALFAVVCCAFQSLMTYPLKPSSPFKIPFRILSFSQAHVVLSLLYEHMTDATLAWIASANGHKYSSCKVRSSMFDDIVVLSYS